MNKIKDSLKKLSSREKVLIYILVILLIICFGWLILLQPQLTNHSSLKISKDSLELQLADLQMNNSSVSTADIKGQISNSNHEIAELNEQLYNVMSKEDIDKLITDLTIEHKISPTNLTMSDITQKELSDKSNDSSKKTKKNQATVYTCVVTQTCVGTKANLLNLIDDVKNINGLQISSVSYENKAGNLDLTITYTIYMVNK